MREKYPRKVPEVSDEAMSMLSPIEEMMLSFHLEDEAVNGLPSCLCVPTDHLATTTPNRYDFHIHPVVWSKTTLITSSVGGTGRGGQSNCSEVN